MPCPTCDHSLARLCRHEDMNFSHCERCGTVVVEIDNSLIRIYTPKLVERCRYFEWEAPGMVNTTGKTYELWRGLGIEESINLPESRG